MNPSRWLGTTPDAAILIAPFDGSLATTVVDKTRPTGHRIGVALDVETQGLNPAVDKVIEIGLRAFLISPTCEFLGVVYSYDALQDPGAPLPERIRELTGLDDAMLAGQSIAEPLRTVDTANRFGLVAALITKHYGGVVGHGVDRTLGTVTTQDHHSLTAAFLTKFQQNSSGQPLQLPLHTVMAGATRFAEVRAFLVKYYGTGGQQQGLFEPLHTVTTKARFGLVMVHGEPYEIVDIGMRMLAPHELFAAQGFPSTYEIAPEFEGKRMTKTTQIALAGNSVCPLVAEAIVAANVRTERRAVA